MRKFAKILLLALVFAYLFSMQMSAFAYDDIYAQGTLSPASRGWAQTGGTWSYYTEGGALKSTFAQIGPYWYFFNENGQMVTGWRQVDGKYYYFSESAGAYPTGACYMGTTTPDGAVVGADGAWTGEGNSAGPQAAGNSWSGPSSVIYQNSAMQAQLQAAQEAAAQAAAQEAAAQAAAAQAAAQSAVHTNPYHETCVEIDLTNQTVYVFKGEELVLQSPCVTGTKGSRDTSVGDWRINSKERDRYLQGTNADGSRYKSWVNFWMPFHGGQGLHDAGWRGTSHANYGGNIYTYDGSHGCVNMPYDTAEALYSIAYVGMPVHVHN